MKKPRWRRVRKGHEREDMAFNEQLASSGDYVRLLNRREHGLSFKRICLLVGACMIGLAAVRRASS